MPSESFPGDRPHPTDGVSGGVPQGGSLGILRKDVGLQGCVCVQASGLGFFRVLGLQVLG